MVKARTSCPQECVILSPKETEKSETPAVLSIFLSALEVTNDRHHCSHVCSLSRSCVNAPAYQRGVAIGCSACLEKCVEVLGRCVRKHSVVPTSAGELSVSRRSAQHLGTFQRTFSETDVVCLRHEAGAASRPIPSHTTLVPTVTTLNTNTTRRHIRCYRDTQRPHTHRHTHKPQRLQVGQMRDTSRVRRACASRGVHRACTSILRGIRHMRPACDGVRCGRD